MYIHLWIWLSSGIDTLLISMWVDGVGTNMVSIQDVNLWGCILSLYVYFQVAN